MKFKVLLLLAAALVAGRTLAQSHNLNCDCCKFSKNYEKNCKNVSNESAPCGCPACTEQKKKEDAFKKAEEKKKRDAVAAKLKAENDAKRKAEQDAYNKKMAEEKAKSDAGKVKIVMPKNDNTKPEKTAAKKEQIIVSNSKVFLSTLAFGHGVYSITSYRMLNRGDCFTLGKDTILKNQFKQYYAIGYQRDSIAIKQKFPPNTGIVQLKETTGKYRPGAQAPVSAVPICDLVDASGKRLLNDNEITYIMHFYENWFIILKGADFYLNGSSYISFASGEIYNIRSKEKVPFQLQEYGNDVKITSVYLNPKEGYPYERPSASCKASVCTQIGSHKYKIYYMSSDNKIETEVKTN